MLKSLVTSKAKIELPKREIKRSLYKSCICSRFLTDSTYQLHRTKTHS